MAYYIKATPLAAKKLGVDGIRNKLPDGNYALWQSDIAQLPSWPAIQSICAQIGALALTPTEMKQEQTGAARRELPTATDSNWVAEQTNAEQAAEEESEAETEEETDQTEEQ